MEGKATYWRFIKSFTVAYYGDSFVEDIVLHQEG
jgi:hypothetical protein